MRLQYGNATIIFFDDNIKSAEWIEESMDRIGTLLLNEADFQAEGYNKEKMVKEPKK